jgi:hypothetical protein
MFGCDVHRQAPPQPSAATTRQVIRERLLAMDVEVVHHQVNGARAGYAATTRRTTRAKCAAERSGVARVKWRPTFGSTTANTFAVPQRRYSLFRFAT